MYVEILAYSSSNWRAISPKEAIVQAHAQWRAELLAASENHQPSQFTYVFPLLSTRFFFSPHKLSSKKRLLLLESRF